MQRIRINCGLWLVLVVYGAIIEEATGLVWNSCSDTSLQVANALCTTVTVPLNYDRPKGPALRIVVSRILHTSSEAEYQGVLLVKTGGVGTTGLTNILRRSKIPENVAAMYDWVGFDPRGTGLTGPSLSCIEDFYPTEAVSVVPYNQQIENFWLNRSKLYIQACRQKHASVLPHIHSVNTVRDMERIRRAIGADKFHIYATSYGSYIGQLYATMFPNRVEKMVLDSPFDSRRVWYQRFLDNSIGVGRLLNSWYEWVAKYDEIYHLGNRSCEVEAHINDIVKQLDGKPIGGSVGQTEWLDLLSSVAVLPDYWRMIASIVAAYINDNDVSGIVDNTGRDSDEGIIRLMTVFCNDRPWSKQWDTARRDIWRIYPQAPLTAWSDRWLSIPCIYWPYRDNPFLNVNGSRVGNILLTVETGAFAYREEGIMDIRRRFPQSRLITVVNGLASSSALSGNTCVDNKIVAYLRDGTVPARQEGDVADVECAAPSLPDPTTTEKSSSAIDVRDYPRRIHDF